MGGLSLRVMLGDEVVGLVASVVDALVRASVVALSLCHVDLSFFVKFLAFRGVVISRTM